MHQVITQADIHGHALAGQAGLRRAAHEVGALASLIEQRFLAVGDMLGTAVAATNRILSSFDALQDALEAPDMNRATDNLRAVAVQLSTFVGDVGQNEALLDNLLRLAERLSGRIARMRAALRGVDVLAINAKIAASHVRDKDQSMEGFAGEIAKALKLFQGNLEVVAGKLNTVTTALRRARQEQLQFLKKRNEASKRMAESLGVTLGLVDERRHRAASAASTVRHKAAALSRDIANAIMALQIGDATRQRLEHATNGLEGGHALTASAGSADGSDMPPLEAAIRGLQSLQLRATANEFERNTALIRDGLVQLAEGAGEIIAIGQEAYSRGSLVHGSFLLGLQDEVMAVKDLLLGVQSAEAEAGEIVEQTLHSIESLARYVQAIQLLETDIRVLALNTTLKCSRLGNAGLSLAVITQELRSCSVSIALDASAALRDLRELVEAGSVSMHGAAGQSRTPFDDLVERMETSAETLYNGGMQLSSSLAALGEDGRAVNAIVDEVGTVIGEQLGVAKIIAGFADRLHGPAVDPLAAASLAREQEAYFAGLRRAYTMEQEREIFDGFIGIPAPNDAAPIEDKPAGTGAADVDLDDFLF